MLFLSACKQSVLDHTSPALNRSLPDETSENVSIYEYKDNKIDYLLTASRIERFYETRRLNAWKVKITTYDIKKRIINTITADTTFVDEARNLVQARGNVVFQTPNGTIKSKLINWDRNVDEIYTPEKVLLIRNGDVLQGDNLRTNSALSFVELNAVSAEGTITQDEIDW